MHTHTRTHAQTLAHTHTHLPTGACTHTRAPTHRRTRARAQVFFGLLPAHAPAPALAAFVKLLCECISSWASASPTDEPPISRLNALSPAEHEAVRKVKGVTAAVASKLRTLDFDSWADLVETLAVSADGALVRGLKAFVRELEDGAAKRSKPSKGKGSQGAAVSALGREAALPLVEVLGVLCAAAHASGHRAGSGARALDAVKAGFKEAGARLMSWTVALCNEPTLLTALVSIASIHPADQLPTLSASSVRSLYEMPPHTPADQWLPLLRCVVAWDQVLVHRIRRVRRVVSLSATWARLQVGAFAELATGDFVAVGRKFSEAATAASAATPTASVTPQPRRRRPSAEAEAASDPKRKGGKGATAAAPNPLEADLRRAEHLCRWCGPRQPRAA
jgi:hypothetical protein